MFNIARTDLIKALPKPEIMPRKKGVRAFGDKRSYIQVISAFDIETTRIESIDNSVMYIWQWNFHNLATNEHIITVYGRTWQEYMETCHKLKDYISQIESDNPVYMVRLVHNLSYEFQFLSAFYDYKPDEVFAIKKRKVARADSFGCIEDRCTYIHSNLSLDKYAINWNAQHRKLSGEEFDYNKKRYSWTRMTPKELAYCENDVLSVTEAYINEMKHYDDNLYTIPLLQRDT